MSASLEFLVMVLSCWSFLSGLCPCIFIFIRGVGLSCLLCAPFSPDMSYFSTFCVLYHITSLTLGKSAAETDIRTTSMSMRASVGAALIFANQGHIAQGCLTEGMSRIDLSNGRFRLALTLQSLVLFLFFPITNLRTTAKI
jgi:hypothetical protein